MNGREKNDGSEVYSSARKIPYLSMSRKARHLRARLSAVVPQPMGLAKDHASFVVKNKDKAGFI